MRTFMAVSTSAEVSQEISKVQEKLKEEGFYGSWPSSSNVHMTLFFFGDISTQKADKISKMMDETSKKITPFSLRVNKVGFFPTRGLPRVVWLGCDEDEEIQNLYREVNTSLKSIGFKFEERFTPHITVGRIKGVPKRWKEKIFDVNFKHVSFECNAIELYHSKPTPHGAIYTLAHRSELGGLKK
jgi:2'-5' RNA ligase